MLGILPAIGWRQGVTIRADQTQIVELIVVLVAIKMIQFQGYRLSKPFQAAAIRTHGVE